ncbi:MAG TPA: ferredoxin [Acidimicrobiales bacterium]|nr:ferredoxin [Acidimicrobiales bacterium]
MKITLNLDLCAGHGQCEDAAPEVFTVNDEGLVAQLIENPGEEYRAKVEDAARRCPADVITVEG